MSNRLSVCLLTRNEESNIERALLSVEGVADEVVVADTGSTDRTVEIARGLGAKVVPFAWDDDFSEGRNFAIAEARGDWILWINPDEELLPESRPRARALAAAGESIFGYLAQVRSVPRKERPDQFVETWDIRLYRKRPDLRYLGRLHPRFTRELADTVARQGQRVSPSDLVIVQHAYTSTLSEPKLRWAIRLLERELRDRPGQLHYLMEYGRSLLLLNEPKGHEVMAEAIEQALPRFETQGPPSPDAQVLLEYVLTTPAERNRSRLTFDRAMTFALRWFPDSPPLLWAIAESYVRSRRPAEAAVLLERLLQLGRTGTYDHSRGFDPRIVGPWALSNLGQCFRALGRTSEARRCFQSLLADPELGKDAARFLAELDAVSKTGP